RLPEVLGLFLRQAPGMQGSLRISAGPHEGEKLAALSRFAQTYTQSPAYQFAVFDYPRFVDPFLKLRARERNLAEGSFCFRIEGGKRLRLAVERGAASITETDGTGDRNSPELSLSNLEALNFFFSPLAAQTTPAIGKSAFLQSLLPLPLFVENPDKI
ncbi:MAG: hypothetical protein FWC45_08910, partial [Treponema sp.]|nr:hypothetical protein [Treponema sp.]